MKRILIVEDNKTLAKLIAKKIAQSLEYEIDIAYQLSEAKLFLKRYNYFVTLVDVNLPDAPNGEVVDYVLEKGTHAIILSASIDENFRAKMLQKNIIDYVSKSGVEDVNYIIQIIQRLEKNEKIKVLVVDDSMVFRKTMKNMLENLFFKVITVAHGEEAVAMLGVHPDISLVITDYNMPVMNGLELTKEIRKTHTKSDLCIIAISSNSDTGINAQFLKNGANDYIKKPFSKEEFSCRINNSIEALENIQLITNHAKRDFLTGLYNRQYFLKKLNEYFTENQDNGEEFVIAMVAIDNFKTIKKNYGDDFADCIIVDISQILRAGVNHKNLVAKFNDDEFCIVLKQNNINDANHTLSQLLQEVEKNSFITSRGEEVAVSISIGASLNNEDTLDEIISQADMMLYNISQSSSNKILFTP